MDTDALRWFKLVAEGVTVTEVSDLEPVTQSGDLPGPGPP